MTAAADRSVTIVWDLPPGAESREIRMSPENAPDPDFGLEGGGYGWLSMGGDFPTTATSFTTPPIDIGTWYVRVGVYDPQEPPDIRWSNVLPVDVKRPSAAGAVKYVGKTKQRKRIEVAVRGTQVVRITLTASCKAYSTGTNRRLFGPWDIVGRAFTATEEQVGGRGRELVEVKGTRRGKRLSGTIRFYVRDDSRGVECNARIPWSATRR